MNEILEVNLRFGVVNEKYGVPNDPVKHFKTKECGVESILYHEPDKIDNKHYVDIIFDNGSVIREFDPVQITTNKMHL